MTGVDKKQLLDNLDETHSTTNKLIAGIDLESPGYDDSDWGIRDIIGHISTWNNQTIKSLEAFNSGKDYSIPDLGEEEDAFNQSEVLKQRGWTTEEVIAEWHLSYDNLKKIIQDIPDEKYPGDLLYPWGEERGNIFDLITFIIDHDSEHREEISKAIK